MNQGDLEPEKIRQMIDGNLDMIGEMPLGQMLEQMLAVEIDLDDAPLESLENLEGLLSESIDMALHDLEGLQEQQLSLIHI